MDGNKKADVKKRKSELVKSVQNGGDDKESQKKKRRYKNTGFWSEVHMGSNIKEEPDILSEAPREIKIVEFAQSRAAEIKELSKLIKTGQGTRQLSQLLPKHMRRRACSHNMKRLPRRLHAIAQKDYENQEGRPKAKCPSRKHRRRPRNLLQEYNRRKRKHVWLETHIWHAKRFKMADKWGYRIPVHPTDKSSRAAYRATQHHCLMQDISYLCCIDIQGPEDEILEGLKHLCSTSIGLTFAAKTYLSGIKEGQTILYAYDKYPYGAIGCVSFFWKPCSVELGTPQHRQLWVWCHPSCYEQLWNEFEKSFKQLEGVDDSKVTKDLETMDKSNLEEKPGDDDDDDDKMKNRLVKIGNIRMESLKDNLVRFRLTGPKSHVLLTDMLIPASIVPADNNSDLWWQKHYSNENMSLGFNQQRELWESVARCNSVAELPPHCIMGLTVRDPRLLKPSKRTKVVQDDEDIDMDASDIKLNPTPDISYSPIWQSDIREQVKVSKMSDILHHLKSEQLIPGSALYLGQEESRIPVILIQRPGVQPHQSELKSNLLTVNANYGAGVDIILPTSWSMAFWVGLIFRGARAGGIRESRNLSKEQGMLHFPADYPDTGAGKSEEEEIYNQLKSKYERRPPAKRVNYTKLGITSPFMCPWSKLVKEWTDKLASLLNNEAKAETQTDKEAYVLRSQQELKKLEYLCCVNVIYRKINQKSVDVSDSGLIIPKLDKKDIDVSVILGKENSLAPVRVTMVTRGAPEEFAIICIPTSEDIRNLVKDKCYGGPLEPIHPDPNKIKKKDKKKSKITNKSSANVQSLGCAGKMIEEKSDSISDSATTDEMESCNQKTDIPLVVNVINSCSREIIGFLKQGGYTLGLGSGTGVGFCSTIALIKLLTLTPKKLPCIVLIRNPMSRQYRFAYLSVLCHNLNSL